MFLPSLEARYQQHPHKAFTCTPQGSLPTGPSSEPSPTQTNPQDSSSMGPTLAPSSQGLLTHSAGSDETIKEGNTQHAGTSSTGESCTGIVPTAQRFSVAAHSCLMAAAQWCDHIVDKVRWLYTQHLGLNAGRQDPKQAVGHPMIEFWTSQTEGSEGSQPSSGPDACRYEHVPVRGYVFIDCCWCYMSQCAVLAVVCCACCAVRVDRPYLPRQTVLYAASLELDICDLCTCSQELLL